jgi:hypothetical protein
MTALTRVTFPDQLPLMAAGNAATTSAPQLLQVGQTI